MKKEIILSEKEIEFILKEHFGLPMVPILYFSGGVINPPKITIVYFESQTGDDK